MVYVETEPSSLGTVAAIRKRVFDGLAPVEDFAAAIDKTPRTVSNYIARGLPVLYVGRTPYVRIDAARDWLRARKTRDLDPRGRGRPRKAAA
jgi:hypothetical protein